MPGETITYQLIVRQMSAEIATLDGLLRVLQEEYGLDAYTARQRLIGPGLAMLGKGTLEKTGKIAMLLHRYGVACWQIEPSPPGMIPSRLQSLEIHHEYVLFECANGPVRLQRGTFVIGVFADLSGALVDKHVKRILAQNTYRGRDAIVSLTRDEMILAIFQGRPVFDFYLLDNHGQPQSAVRVLPGRFSPTGLGERATLSSRGNLEAMLALIEEYAQPFHLHCEFGLNQLPHCQVERLIEGTSSLENNLKSLNQYGWLLTSLKGSGRPEEEAHGKAATLTVGFAAVAAIGQPALGTVLGIDGTAAVAPGLGEAGGELGDVLCDEASDVLPKGQVVAPARKDLPPPPERPEASMSLRRMLTMSGFFAGAALLALVMADDSQLLRSVARYGTRAGAVPGLVAFALLWTGIYFVRLKRQVENTPTSKVRSIAMGMVEVQGQARRQYALVAPMTQAACVYYRLRKYRREDHNKWNLIRDVDSSHVAFQIDDGTGRVVVEPHGASVKAKTRLAGYPGQSPLAFTGFDSADENEKWVEDIIYEGTTLYVLGFAQPRREAGKNLRERTVEKLRALKLDHGALHRYDTDGDGQVGADEWQVARREAEQAVLREQLAEGEGRRRQEEHIVIARAPQRGMPFIITEAVSEANLTRSYGLISLPLLVAGLTAAAFSLYKLLEFLGV
ncbi:MAG: hypothetical protein ACSLFH_13245 [Desulfuromonadales bacterium]